MSKPVFAVPVADLERGPRRVSWVIPEAWLRETFETAGALPTGDGALDVELSKTGPEVMVRGEARANVTVPCVVTLDPLPFELKPEVFLLLAPARSAPFAAERSPGARRADKAREPGKSAKSSEARQHGAAAPPRGRRGRAKAGAWDEAPELTDQDAAKDTYDGERVVLDEYLREFLLLELPMYPRRSDLPSAESPAIAPPSETAPAEAPIDPRLMPLAQLASRLRDQKKE